MFIINVFRFQIYIPICCRYLQICKLMKIICSKISMRSLPVSANWFITQWGLNTAETAAKTKLFLYAEAEIRVF